MAKLVHPELSYQVRGVLLHVNNALARCSRKSAMEEAVAIGLKSADSLPKRRKNSRCITKVERVGLYYVDV